MKALILAGGRGTRLRPLTHTHNKHLLPIANQPMILRIILDAIDLGIKEIIININKGDQELPDALGDGSKYGVKFHYIEQEEPNGMMWLIKLAQEIIGDEEFLFSAGDNILAGGLQKHYEDFKSKKSDAHVLVVKRPDYYQFGVAVLEGDRIVKTVEKPKEFVSDLVLTAIYFFTPKVFEAFDHIKPIDPKDTGIPEYYPPTVINWMIKNNMYFSASEVTGWWKDTGAPKDIINANAFALDKKEFFQINGEVIETKVSGDLNLGKGSQLINCTVTGPATIGENCIIKDSNIGPYVSIANGCNITRTNIKNSILMKNCEIINPVRMIYDSLIGQNVQIFNKNRVGEKNTMSLVIGDNSQVNLSKV